MTRARAIGVAAAGLALQALLLGGAAAALPGPARLALAFALVVVLPGSAFVALGARPAGGGWLAAGWALGLGLAWDAALLLGTRAAGLPFLALLPWTPLAGVLPWGLVIARPPAGRPEPGPALARWATVAILLAAAFATLHVARFGPPMGFSSDSPDHVGTLRRMLQSGDLFPADAFFRDAGSAGADPRKGLWHGVVALLARAAALDPLETWRWLGALLAPFFVLNVALLGFLCRGPAGAALAAWALVLTYGGGVAQGPVRQAVFATRVADQLAVAAAVAVLSDLARRSRGTRLAAVGLGFAAVAAHAFAALQLALTLPALALGLLASGRRPGGELRRLAGTALLMAAACLPYLLLRAGQAYAPANPIHTEPQGLTWLAGSLRVVSIGQLWDWMGPAWVLVPLAWPWLWARGRGNPAALYLLTASLAVALTVYDPPVVALLQPRLGYLLMRAVWIVPFAALVGWLLPELAAAARARGPAAVRVAAGALLALALALLAPAVREAAEALRRPGLVAAADRREDPARWRSEFEWMRRSLAPGCVVLSDPATSYLVPMCTGLPVVTLADQHSSPDDPHALERILESRDALDPHGSWERTRAVLRGRGVGAVVLDDRFVEPPRLDYWRPDHRWFVAARARFDAHPDAFPPLLDAGDFVVYGVRDAALDALRGPAAPRPEVEPWRPGTVVADVPGDPAEHLPGLAGLALSGRVAAPGESLDAVARWHAARPARPGAYQVVVRFDRDLPAGFAPPAFLAKPARKLLERLRHERYRFRADHLPAGGAYGVDLWRPDELVRDSFGLRVPADAAEGTYRVEVRMLRQPHYPNLRLGDWFFDRDSYSGAPAGTLVVRRGARAGGEGAPGGPR